MLFKKKKIGQKVSKKNFLIELIEVFSKVENPQEMKQLLKAILTPEELDQIKKRWQIIKLLQYKYTQREVAKMLQISTAKVNRGSKEIKYGSGIFQKIFKRIYK